MSKKTAPDLSILARTERLAACGLADTTVKQSIYHKMKFPVVKPKDPTRYEAKLAKKTERRLRQLTGGAAVDPHRKPRG